MIMSRAIVRKTSLSNSVLSNSELEYFIVLDNIGEIKVERECKSDFQYFIKSLPESYWTDSDESTQGHESIPFDSGRQRMWKLLMGDKPLPEPYVGAVDDCAGLFDQLVPTENDRPSLTDILRRIRRKRIRRKWNTY